MIQIQAMFLCTICHVYNEFNMKINALTRYISCLFVLNQDESALLHLNDRLDMRLFSIMVGSYLSKRVLFHLRYECKTHIFQNKP